MPIAIYDNRIKYATLRFSDLAYILSGEYRITNLPMDAVIIAISNEPLRHAIKVLISSQEFELLKEGETVPDFMCNISTTEYYRYR